MSHILLNCSSVQLFQIATFFFFWIYLEHGSHVYTGLYFRILWMLKMIICRSLCHSINLLLRIFFPVKFYKVYFHGKFITNFCYLIGEKKSRQKMTNFFADYFFTDDYFYERLIFTDEYSYQHFFYKEENLVFSNLKIPLVYLFNFKFG